jgi:signal transduction histidine kinase
MSVYTNGNAEMSRFSPYEKIKEVFEFLERKLNRKMIKTQIKCDEDEIKIYANPSQFLQICMNLTLNSMDAIDHDHGIIRFEIKKTDENITIIQSDNGCGIDADDIENIFDLMYTTKPVGEGTGIGLFTFKKIMENHGGKFSVKSEKGKGAEFTFTFPLIKTGIDYSKFLK